MMRPEMVLELLVSLQFNHLVLLAWENLLRNKHVFNLMNNKNWNMGRHVYFSLLQMGVLREILSYTQDVQAVGMEL